MTRSALPAERAQREQLAEWEAALIASGLPVAGLDAARPKARLTFAAPLSAGLPGEAELADLWLVERLPAWRVRQSLEAALPPGYSLVDLYDVWLGEPPLPGQVAASVYRAILSAPAEPGRIAAAADALLAATSLPRVRRKGEGTVAYDLRPFLAGIDVAPRQGGGAVVRMTLRHDPAKGVGRPEEALAALAESLGEGPLQPESLVRERLALNAPPAPESAPPPGPRRPPPGRSPDASTPRAALPGHRDRPPHRPGSGGR